MVLLLAGGVSAQFQVNRKDKVLYPKDKINKIAKEVRPDGWITFRETLRDKPEDIALKHKEAFGLGTADELRRTEAQADELGITRYRYTQHHGGVEVEGADFSIYGKGGRATYASGRLVQTLAALKSATITEKQALRAALVSVPARKYQWQDPRHEQDIRTTNKDSSATHYPKGKLLYALTTNDGNAEDAAHRLAYRFDIMRLDPQAYEAVYIGALTGRLLRTFSLVSSNGSCQNNQIDTWYNGNRQVGTWWDRSRSRFRLQDFCRGGGFIYTKYSNGSGRAVDDFPYGVYIEARGSEASPLNSNWNWDFAAKSAASTHYSAQATHWYFKNVFSPFLTPGYYKETRILVNERPDNASSFEQNNVHYITIGRGSTGARRSFAETDVVAHEFTHGVVRNSARLTGGEADALDESFADIFGEMVESTNNAGGQNDWINGFHVGDGRPMADEVAVAPFVNARVWRGRGWNTAGQPHQNAGVQNRWFYLLSVGGTGERNIVVNGIGKDKAAHIAYRSLTRHLGSNAAYPDARAGAILAATELYGPCSAEVVATTNAWAAVGVGNPVPIDFISEILGGPSTHCMEAPAFGYFQVCAPAGSVKVWSLDGDPAFGFSALGQVEDVILNQIPPYPSTATLSVRVTLPGASTSQTRTFPLYTITCMPPNPPADCPPTQICPNMVQQARGGLTQLGGASTIYPNPADAVLELSLAAPATGSTTVSIRDLLGRVLSDQRVAAGQQAVALDVARLPAGTYVLIVTGAGNSLTKRFQINH